MTTIAATPARVHITFWFLMLIAQGLGFILFKDLADLSQWLIQSDREFTMAVWYNRWTIALLCLLSLLGCIVLWYRHRSIVNTKLGLVLVALCLFNWYVGMLNTGFMFRSQQHAEQAKFVSVEVAPRYLNEILYTSYEKDQYDSIDEISVLVLETDQGARAYADYYLLQPHVANAGTIDGEDVVMTYCGLTNMGIAYSPVINGEPVELRAITQLRNNLVMVDKNSGEPIQQFWGSLERDGEYGPSMREWPSMRMPFGSFRQLYPDGLVYVNGIRQQSDNILVQLFDKVIRDGIMVHAVRALQWQTDKPAFPTITEFDDRLPIKQLVWGISIGGDHVAYTKDFVEEQSGVLNVTIGDRPVVINYDAGYDSIGAFYNDSGAAVGEVDYFGNSDRGTLERVESLKSGVFWFIWRDFNKSTDVNRV
jgi:hypothetical protein